MRNGGESALKLRRHIPRSHLCHFAISSFSLASHFHIRIHTRFYRQTLIRSERWRRRRELPNRRRQAPRRRAPKLGVTKSGCHREWEKRSSIDWWKLAFFLTTLSPDGSWPSVSPSQCLIPMKWWYLRIISGMGWDFLFIHS